MYEVVLAAFVGSLISLDRTAFLQAMISQPLVAGPVIGLLLGDAIAGLTIGCIIELLWIGTVPVGGYIPPNETAASVIATSLSILAGRDMGSQAAPLMVFSIILSIPLAVVSQKVDILVRSYNSRFALNADKLLESGNISQIGRQNLKGLLSFFIASFFSLFVLIFFGILLGRMLYPLIPEPWLRGSSIALYLLLSLGIAVSMRTANGNRIGPIFAAGFIIGMIFIYLRG